ncbi:SMP-30/gluconolactonase/LRE family protein [Haloplanus pelagicus]|uniref:SMP-30/gluconolactonase/LRE family protein n=1 Tax=Haloplanus pelagicus TaxID=2949995 RepID=UPI00203EE8E1|nr:SMP-30/gluconolactonase/LRE family protein [Haloplanus sp. HW8-1]
MSHDITVVADYGCQVAEGPIWHPDDEALYWIDVPAGSLFRYRPETDEHAHVFESDLIAGITVEADGSLLLFEDGGVVRRLDTETWDATPVLDITEEADTRFNDVIADPAGRVFAGTMPTDRHPGRLYRLDPDGTYHRLIDDLALPNGLGFTTERDALYLTESKANRIRRYAYEETSGQLSDRTVFAEVDHGDGLPDGLAVDTTGHVWSAEWNGGQLVRYDDSGTVVEKVSCPAETVASLTFGGENYETAYVTTGLGYYERRSKAELGRAAGALLATDLGVEGRPQFRSRITNR